MMEIVEYRPGKWAKVVDGRMVGRATADEVAAWQAQQGLEAAGGEAIPLDIDLDLRPVSASPGHSLDVPLKPAFERRRQPNQPAKPASPSPAAPVEGDTLDISIEAAIAQDASARRYSERSAKAKPSGPVMVRRRARKEEASVGEPAREATTTPVPAEPTAKRAEPTPTEPAVKGAEPKPVAPRSTRHETERPAPDEALPAAASEEPSGPRYWWIYNAYRQPVEVFLQEWLPKYKAKFGHDATFVHCHIDDLAGVEQSGLDVTVSSLLQPGHFYLGHEAE